jgi:hypothetical protein
MTSQAFPLLFKNNTDDEYLQCAYLSQRANGAVFQASFPQQANFPCYPVLVVNERKSIFGVNNIIRYFASAEILTSRVEDLLDLEEFQIKPYCTMLLAQKVDWEGNLKYLMSVLIKMMIALFHDGLRNPSH